MNLCKLFYDTPGVTPPRVKQALEQVFPQVDTEYRGELFFNYQFRCSNEQRTRLIVRYGWSDRENGWVFEALKGDKNER